MSKRFALLSAVAFSTLAGSETSQAIGIDSLSRLATSFSLDSLRATRTTRAPLPASADEIASPIPREAPVTTAVLPLREGMSAVVQSVMP